jgi:predicted PolB exonuclease-like 3'-5' exonuclease
LEINNNQFSKNEAYLEGGAIKWCLKQPNIGSLNAYQSNKAQYGNNIASYPIRNRIKIKNKNTSIIISDSSSKVIKLDDLAGGSEISFRIFFEVIDLYENIVTTAKRFNFLVYYNFLFLEKYLWNSFRMICCFFLDTKFLRILPLNL